MEERDSYNVEKYQNQRIVILAREYCQALGVKYLTDQQTSFLIELIVNFGFDIYIRKRSDGEIVVGQLRDRDQNELLGK